jgi:hypothetical protein
MTRAISVTGGMTIRKSARKHIDIIRVAFLHRNITTDRNKPRLRRRA